MTDAEILEMTYFDTCNIKRNVKIKDDETGITSNNLITVAENVKCSVSKKDDQYMSIEGKGKLSFIHKLFINPSTDIQEGDIIEVSSMGKISIYLASKPFLYPSHAEILIEHKERV